MKTEENTRHKRTPEANWNGTEEKCCKLLSSSLQHIILLIFFSSKISCSPYPSFPEVLLPSVFIPSVLSCYYGWGNDGQNILFLTALRNSRHDRNNYDQLIWLLSCWMPHLTFMFHCIQQNLITFHLLESKGMPPIEIGQKKWNIGRCYEG